MGTMAPHRVALPVFGSGDWGGVLGMEWGLAFDLCREVDTPAVWFQHWAGGGPTGSAEIQQCDNFKEMPGVIYCA